VKDDVGWHALLCGLFAAPGTQSLNSCQRHTHGLDVPVSRMIALVPCPSAVASTIRARQTVLVLLLRSAMIAWSRARFAGLNRWKTLAAAERMGLEGVVSKRCDAPYRSGSQCGWIKTKTRAWREANKDRWRLFERQ